MNLAKKIAETITLLQRGERAALSLCPDEGYYLAFSGGKDSQVMLSLAKLAGVKFRAYYSVTSIDPPENVYFIRNFYPEVTFVHPKVNFFRLVAEYGLPTMNKRFCCSRLKEGMGAGRAVLTGVRAEESSKRSTYAQIEIYSRRKEHEGKRKGRTFEELEINEFQCIKGKDRLMIRPILNWTEEEIWEYILTNHLPVNPCYNNVGRVGCMFCPFATKSQILGYEMRYAKFYELLMLSVTKWWGKTDNHILDGPEDYYQWWKSKRSLNTYIRQKQAARSASPLMDEKGLMCP